MLFLESRQYANCIYTPYTYTTRCKPYAFFHARFVHALRTQPLHSVFYIRFNIYYHVTLHMACANHMYAPCIHHACPLHALSTQLVQSVFDFRPHECYHLRVWQ